MTASTLRDLRRVLATPEAPTTGRVLEVGGGGVTVATRQGVRTYKRPTGAALLPGDAVRTAGAQLVGRLVSQSETYAE